MMKSDQDRFDLFPRRFIESGIGVIFSLIRFIISKKYQITYLDGIYYDVY